MSRNDNSITRLGVSGNPATEQPLLPLLKQFFGFETFRPLQENIIRDSLAGKDVFALLPTGGGKSLCFQLPALARPGLTLVISPLISLMKDQVDALEASGIAATYLNSSLSPGVSWQRVKALREGEYRLLYVAPERAMLSTFLNDAVTWNINLVAVDEAHCISEWGHDFRPEYRQLPELRKLMPAVPFMALTATATSRVQSDIHRHLQLRDAASYVASFNRPNLNYSVISKIDPYRQLLSFLRKRAKESGIVYCQSRRSTEMLSQRLLLDGISAAPYHAGMESADRGRNQEKFLRDEINVVCATIAFGMGINKSNVRFVVHYDLPKNIEGYYQETGRAGRDGLPSECLLIFSIADMVKQLRFIEEKEDEQQRKIAKQQLDQMVRYAESHECRRLLLLRYFGEEYPHVNCAGCDNCFVPQEMIDATTEAQKFLSCVQRIKQKSGFSVGLRYVAEVLTGGNTEKIRRWEHTKLSTYGIGKEHSREEWISIGRELVRHRLLHQDEGEFPVVQVSPAGLEALERRTIIKLVKPMRADALPGVMEGEQDYDTALFDRLKSLRKQLADERDVPAFIIFSDYSLRQMARQYPRNETEFTRISGVAEKKLKDYGAKFVEEIGAYLRTNQRKEYKMDSPAPRSAKPLNVTTRETLRLFRMGKSIDAIAEARELKVGTIEDHLFAAVNAGELLDVERLVKPAQQQEIHAAFDKLGYGNLTGVVKSLEGRYSYGLLRIIRALAQRNWLRKN